MGGGAYSQVSRAGFKIKLRNIGNSLDMLWEPFTYTDNLLFQLFQL